jgi:ankyrin repeat protein
MSRSPSVDIKKDPGNKDGELEALLTKISTAKAEEISKNKDLIDYLKVCNLLGFGNLLYRLAQRQLHEDIRILDIDLEKELAKRITLLIKSHNHSSATICKVFSCISKLSLRGDCEEIDQLFSEIISQSNKKWGVFSNKQIAIFINSLARLGYEINDNPFLINLCRYVAINHEQFTSDDLSFLCLSFIKMKNFVMAGDLICHAIARNATEASSSQALDALRRAIYFYELETKEGISIPVSIAGLFESIDFRAPKTSRYQSLAARILSEEGFAIMKEFQIAPGVFIDIFAEKDNEQFYIEYDGQIHFNKKGDESPATKLRNYFHIKKLQTILDPEKKKFYLTINDKEFFLSKDKKRFLRESILKAKRSGIIEFPEFVGAAGAGSGTSDGEVLVLAKAGSSTHETEGDSSLKALKIAEMVALNKLKANSSIPVGSAKLILQNQDLLNSLLIESIENNKVIFFESLIANGLDVNYKIDNVDLLTRSLMGGKYSIAASLIIAGVRFETLRGIDLEQLQKSIIDDFSRIEDVSENEIVRFLDLYQILLHKNLKEHEERENIIILIKKSMQFGHGLALDLLKKNKIFFNSENFQDFFENSASADDETIEYLLNINSKFAEMVAMRPVSVISVLKEKSSKRTIFNTKLRKIAAKMLLLDMKDDLILFLKRNRAKDADIYEIMKLAVFYKNPSILDKLLSEFKSVRIKKKEPIAESSLLVIAADNDSRDIVDVLLRHKFDINQVSGKGPFTALSVAIGRGYIELIKILLSKEDILIDKPDNLPIIIACSSVSYDCVELLLNHRTPIDTNFRAADGQNLLFSLLVEKDAVAEDRREIFKLLLERGIDRYAVNYAGYSTLFLAVEKNLEDIVDLILNYNPETIDSKKANLIINSIPQDVTCLYKAVVCNNLRVVEMLLHNGADPNLGKGEMLPLSYACQRGYVEIARFILDSGKLEAGESYFEALSRTEILKSKTEINELLISRGLLSKRHISLLFAFYFQSEARDTFDEKILDFLIDKGIDLVSKIEINSKKKASQLFNGGIFESFVNGYLLNKTPYNFSIFLYLEKKGYLKECFSVFSEVEEYPEIKISQFAKSILYNGEDLARFFIDNGCDIKTLALVKDSKTVITDRSCELIRLIRRKMLKFKLINEEEMKEDLNISIKSESETRSYGGAGAAAGSLEGGPSPEVAKPETPKKALTLEGRT